jgi:archaeal type IV pilus assembly protein PilA
MNTYINNRRLHSRRGVAPVIATLLLVAIAVVGGAIVFAYSQNFFSSSQLSGRPNIESLKVIGYDGRDIATGLFDHNGVAMTQSAGVADNLKNTGEYVAAYLKNDSVQAVTLSEVRLGGATYSYLPTAFAAGNNVYKILLSGGATDLFSSSQVGDIQPGQTVTVVMKLGENMKIGRDAQFKITTTNGAVFVGTVVTGQQSG